jgi:hypothetical protein
MAQKNKRTVRLPDKWYSRNPVSPLVSRPLSRLPCGKLAAATAMAAEANLQIR